MKLIYANEKTVSKKSIFLAGPTPRSKKVESWRPNAVAVLSKFGYNGVVFIPEDRSGEWKHSYIDQVKWEDRALHLSSLILFWIPRCLDTMPGFTTNVEFGRFLGSGKIILSFPKNAPKMKYLEYHAIESCVPVFYELESAIEYAVDILK